MSKKLQNFIQKFESHLALFLTLGGGAVIGAVTTWIASFTDWLESYGPISWVFAGLFAALIFASVIMVYAFANQARANAKAVNKWKNEVDDINPLDRDFHTRRIDLNKLRHPVYNSIENKRFTDCELYGPCNIYFEDHINLDHCGFVDCDVIIIRPGSTLRNAVRLRYINGISSTFYRCAIYIAPSQKPLFDEIGASYASFIPGEEDSHQ